MKQYPYYYGYPSQMMPPGYQPMYYPPGWSATSAPQGGYIPPQGAYMPAPPGYPGNDLQPASPTPGERTPFFNISNPKFLKGAALGAAAAYLLTNENVQRAAIKTSVKAWMMLQGGLEEFKERFKDAEAEITSENGE